MKKITYDEYKTMTANEIGPTVYPNTKNENIPTVHFTWDPDLNTFVLTGYQGKVN